VGNVAPRIEITKITPELAEEWLKKNTHNRSIRPKLVDALSRAIERDEWVLNGEAIKFNASGKLDDGQHRLHAVIQAGKPIESIVVYDLEEGAQDTMDTGARRKFSDVLRLRGELDTASLASLIRLFSRYQTRDLMSRDFQPTNQELLKVLEDNPGLREAVKVASTMRGSIPGPSSAYGCFAYVVSNIEPEDAEEFINRFVDGVGLDATSPILHLRNYLLKINGQRDKPRTEIILAHMFKAWNLYREGAKVRVLSFKSGGKAPESYPFPK
jgi:hypothetical protein